MGCTTLFQTFLLFSCDNKDEDLWEKVDGLVSRVERLENTSKEVNANIESIQAILDAVKNNYSIVSFSA